MERYFSHVRQCALFDNIADEHIMAMLGCIGAKLCTYKKNQTILAEGDPARYIGIILTGKAHIFRDDYYGNRTIVAQLESAHLFGESFACAEVKSLPVNVVATEDTEVLIMDCRRITQSCCNACEFHNQLIFNLMKMMAQKNLMFNEKIQITSMRTTREKLMAYLSLQAKKNRSKIFTIPYNRQELADYLQVERSGLSVEISKLCKEGVIETEKKTFQIL